MNKFLGISYLFHDKAGLDLNLQEWKQLCRKASEKNMTICKQTDLLKFEKVGILQEIVIKTTYTECTPETKPFGLT